jgi:OHCU decarboxylase
LNEAIDGGLERLNALPRALAVAELLQCCGSHAWAAAMADARPFADRTALHDASDAVWRSLARDDWLEAFRAHPRIGERASVKHRGAAWSEQEQARVLSAADAERAELATLNRLYEQRFGHIFLICATGLAPAEIREALRRRVENDPADELHIAAEEQRRITRLRLERLL